METVRAKLVRKASKSPVRGFVLEGHDGWFNANTPVIPDLAKVEIGTEIEVEYIQKGVFRNVSKITIVENNVSSPKQAEQFPGGKCSVCGKELKNPKYPTCWECKDKVKKEEPKNDKPKCVDCGKELKDNKYKLCFMCNKNKAEKKPKEEAKPKEEKQKEVASKNYYNNPERDEMIRRGNALNAASAAVSGNMVGSDPATLAEAVRVIATELLEWLKAE